MPASFTAIENSKLLMAIAGKGGALEVYGRTSDSSADSYKVMTLQGAASVKRDSGWLLGWSAAIKSLSRYPWPQFAGIYVDPDVQHKVWLAIEDYQKLSPQPVRSGALERWRRICGMSV